MEDKLFDTEQKRASALSALSSLRFHPGWELIQKIQDANIEVLKVQLENGTECVTKADFVRLGDKIKLTREFRDIVDKMIGQLMPEEQSAVNIDPFYSLEELREKRREVEQ